MKQKAKTMALSKANRTLNVQINMECLFVNPNWVKLPMSLPEPTELLDLSDLQGTFIYYVRGVGGQNGFLLTFSTAFTKVGD